MFTFTLNHQNVLCILLWSNKPNQGILEVNDN